MENPLLGNQLLRHLRETEQDQILLPEEHDILESAEVRPLSPEKQWEHLASHRRKTYWVTLVVTGIRLLILGIGSVGAVVYGVMEYRRSAGWPMAALAAMGGLVFLWTLLTTRALRERLRALRRSLPAFESIGYDGEATNSDREGDA